MRRQEAVPAAVLAECRRLARRNPKTGEKRSLRAIADELARLGHMGPSGKPYFPHSIKQMLAHVSAISARVTAERTVQAMLAC